MIRRHWKILLALFGGLLLAALACFYFPQQVLTIDSGPVTGDVLVVLGGRPDRPQRAAELFQAGAAPKIIVTGFGDDICNEQILEQNGVAGSNILVEGKSRTTRENAKFSIAMLHALGAHRVIIVTSWYHSRRALHCFEHFAPDIIFYSRPSYYGYPGQTNAETMKPETLKGEKTPPPLKATSSDLRPVDSLAPARSALSGPSTDSEFLSSPPMQLKSPQRGEGNLPERGGEGVATNVSMSASQLSAFRARQRAEWKAVRGYTDTEYVKLLGYWVCYGVCPI